ncbi:MAG TPA: hypothetical protein VGD98_07220 [Ktedonobacteraceae bacterium]
MSVNGEKRQAQLAEVIEMGEHLFEMALANYAVQQDAREGGERTAHASAGNVEELRSAAETFFRVLRKLVATDDSSRAG